MRFVSLRVKKVWRRQRGILKRGYREDRKCAGTFSAGKHRDVDYRRQLLADTGVGVGRAWLHRRVVVGGVGAVVVDQEELTSNGNQTQVKQWRS